MSTKKNTIPFNTGTFYRAPVVVNKTSVTIELPIKVAEYFELDGPIIYWAPVGGVIQLSGKQPHMVIPMMCVNPGQFVPHKAAGDAMLPVVEPNHNVHTTQEVVQPAQPARPPARRRAPTPAPAWLDIFGENPQ